MKKRLIVGLSGASGIIYGIRLLEILHGLDTIETHLIISTAARQTTRLETDYTFDQIQALADKVYNFNNLAASISHQNIDMVIIPCATKTLARIASAATDNLILRAAGTVLKDRRKLVLVLGETPLRLGHVRLMTQAIEMGAIVMPPMPAFEHRPKTIDDLINQTVRRVLGVVDIEVDPHLVGNEQAGLPRPAAWRG